MNQNRTAHSSRKISVLFEDNDFIIFDKPPGMLVIPSPKQEKNTLMDIVNAQYRSPNESSLHPCHRLDRDTSGIILFAKGKKNQQLMMDEFKFHRVEKVYLAFVHGKITRPAGEMKSEIKDFDQIKFNKNSRAKLAITRYKLKENKRSFSVVYVFPLTGRTNQIRIHFSELGYPLVGERKYAFGKDFELKFRRTALHAIEFKWIHPITKKEIRIESPIPQDMEQFHRSN